jgi:hypothetical protein
LGKLKLGLKWRKIKMKHNSIRCIRGLFFSVLPLFLVISFTPEIEAGTQMVVFSSDNIVVSPGQSAELELHYDVPDGAKKTTGLGLRIHYDSRVIASLGFLETYGEGLLAEDEAAQDDVKDLDNDPVTDKYIGVAWMAIRGDWPGSVELPSELGRILLRVRVDAVEATTYLNLTSSSTPVGYDFYGGSAEISIP